MGGSAGAYQQRANVRPCHRDSVTVTTSNIVGNEPHPISSRGCGMRHAHVQGVRRDSCSITPHLLEAMGAPMRGLCPALVLPPSISGHLGAAGCFAAAQATNGAPWRRIVRRCHAHWLATTGATLWIAGTPLIPSTGNHRSAETDVLTSDHTALNSLWWSLLTAAQRHPPVCLSNPSPMLRRTHRTPALASSPPYGLPRPGACSTHET